MLLKPYRNYSEAFVINGLYALTTTGTRGSIVTLVSFSGDDPVDIMAGTNLAAGIGGVFSYRPIVPSKVQLAPSGSIGGVVLGMLLYDVMEFNPTDGRLLIYSDKNRQAELQAVISGQAVPIVTKGVFEAVGWDLSAGNPGPGSGVGISNSGGGVMSVLGPNVAWTAGRIGTFLGPTGADGGALFKLEL